MPTCQPPQKRLLFVLRYPKSMCKHCNLCTKFYLPTSLYTHRVLTNLCKSNLKGSSKGDVFHIVSYFHIKCNIDMKQSVIYLWNNVIEIFWLWTNVEWILLIGGVNILMCIWQKKNSLVYTYKVHIS